MLRGLGGCRFEDAERRARTRRAARLDDRVQRDVGGHERVCRRSPSAATSCPAADRCDDSWLVRPDASGDALRARRSRSTPGYCTLSMLFSDWSHSGQRDLRVSNDRHYYLDGEEQLWRDRSPAQPPAPYTEADGWQPLQIWGMGIASQDITGDGCPRCSSPARRDNKLQTLAAGAARPDYRDIALDAWRHRAAALRGRRRAAVDGVAPGVRRREQRRHRSTCSSPRATSTRRSTRPSQRPEQPVHRASRTARSSRAPRQAGHRRLRTGTRRRRRRPQPRRPARPRRGPPPQPNVTLWRNVGRGDAAQPEADGPLASTCGCSSRPRTSTPSARGSR